jgi:hypothetical protein
MYSLRLTCKPDEVDLLIAELLEAGTIGIQETEEHGNTVLIAGFPTNECHRELLTHFAQHSPEWSTEPATDWTAVSRAAWPSRALAWMFHRTKLRNIQVKKKAPIIGVANAGVVLVGHLRANREALLSKAALVIPF